MNEIKVKFYRFDENAKLPEYAHATDAGMDLYATSYEYDYDKKQATYSFGFGLEIPDGYFMAIVPRSSIKNKTLRLSNNFGVIDSSYRGEIKAVFDEIIEVECPPYPNCSYRFEAHYKVGDKIAQMFILPCPRISLEVVDYLSNTDRGAGGFGSTDKMKQDAERFFENNPHLKGKI